MLVLHIYESSNLIMTRTFITNDTIHSAKEYFNALEAISLEKTSKSSKSDPIGIKALKELNEELLKKIGNKQISKAFDKWDWKNIQVSGSDNSKESDTSDFKKQFETKVLSKHKDLITALSESIGQSLWKSRAVQKTADTEAQAPRWSSVGVLIRESEIKTTYESHEITSSKKNSTVKKQFINFPAIKAIFTMQEIGDAIYQKPVISALQSLTRYVINRCDVDNKQKISARSELEKLFKNRENESYDNDFLGFYLDKIFKGIGKPEYTSTSTSTSSSKKAPKKAKKAPKKAKKASKSESESDEEEKPKKSSKSTSRRRGRR